MDFKQNKLRQIMAKKRKEREDIKKLNIDPLIDSIHKKRKPTISPNQLPF